MNFDHHHKFLPQLWWKVLGEALGSLLKLAFLVWAVLFVLLFFPIVFLCCCVQKQPPSIHYVAQRDPTDCGQACLTMLGYDGYGKDFWMTSPDILSRVCGVREIEPGSERADREPHMLIVCWSHSDKEHWILQYRNHVYDPAIGYRSIKEEWFKHNAVTVKREFVVPFAREELK